MATQEGVYQEVVRILREMLHFDGELRPDITIEALALDSIRFMQLLVYLEEALGFRFDLESQISSIRNAHLGQFASLVHESLRPAS